MTNQQTDRSKCCCDFHHCSNVCQRCGDQCGYSTQNCRCPLCQASSVSDGDNWKIPSFLLELWQSMVHCSRHHCDKCTAHVPLDEKQPRHSPNDTGIENAENAKNELKERDASMSPVSDVKTFENDDDEEYACSCCGQKLYCYFNAAAGRRVITHSPTYTTDEGYVNSCNTMAYDPEVDIVLPCPYQNRVDYETTYSKSFRHPEVVAREADANYIPPMNICASYHLEQGVTSPSFSRGKSHSRSFDSIRREGPLFKTYQPRKSLSPSKYGSPDRRSKRSLRPSKSSHKMDHRNRSKPHGAKSAHALQCGDAFMNVGEAGCNPNDSLCYLSLAKRQNNQPPQSIASKFKNSMESEDFPYSKSVRSPSIEPHLPESPTRDSRVLLENRSPPKHSNVVSVFRKKKSNF